MKLLNKTTNYYLLILLPIYAIGSLVFFLVARQLNIYHVDSNLKSDKSLIIEHAKKDHPRYIESELSHDFFITHIPNDSVVEESIQTLEELDSTSNEMHSYRQLTTSLVYDGVKYEIILKKSMVEFSTYLYSLSVLFSMLTFSSTVFFLILKKRISARIWAPFYRSLKDLQNFHVGKNMVLKPVETDIDEFNELHETLDFMTRRIDQDYRRQKDFLDMISHESQTPLSVISMHVENLAQYGNLSERASKELDIIQRTAHKLAKMNKALLLISRIDNFQYTDKERCNLSNTLNDHLETYEELIKRKNLDLKIEADASVSLHIDPTMLDVLLANLIQNAIRHNVENGFIHITISPQQMVFENSGEAPTFDIGDVFDKFVKSHKTESNGLGMTIVKRICDSVKAPVSFDYVPETKSYRLTIGLEKQK